MEGEGGLLKGRFLCSTNLSGMFIRAGAFINSTFMVWNWWRTDMNKPTPSCFLLIMGTFKALTRKIPDSVDKTEKKWKRPLSKRIMKILKMFFVYPCSWLHGCFVRGLVGHMGAWLVG